MFSGDWRSTMAVEEMEELHRCSLNGIKLHQSFVFEYEKTFLNLYGENFIMT